MSEKDPLTGTYLSLIERSQEAIDAEMARRATIEAAVRKVIDLVNAKLPPDSKMSDRDFISEVAGAVDNPDVFRALEKVK